ncbi:MAG: RDD family protein [Chloroflexota bacterium]
MVSQQERLAQIFIWRQTGAPDIEYARQLLSAVNPDAVRVISGDNPPIKLFAVLGAWPEDPWERALLDMRATPSPDGRPWTDTTRYDLAGWQGADQRTGDNIFIVTAYRKANAPAARAFEGAPAPAPSPSYNAPTTATPQVPYYPQRPTGPIDWPPRTNIIQYNAAPGVGSQNNKPHGIQQEYVPLGLRPQTSVLLGEATPESYLPFYGGFPQRMVAGLIDLIAMSVFQIITVLLWLRLPEDSKPKDFLQGLGTFASFLCLALLIFAAYHVIQWTLWGQTLGKNLMGIKVVDRDGKKPQFGRSLLRMTGYIPSFLLGGIGGFLLIAFDPRRQALHDKIAETYVVPERPSVHPPPGLPGYAVSPLEALSQSGVGAAAETGGALGMANVSGAQIYEVVQFAHEQPAIPQVTARPTGEIGIFREIAMLDESLRTVVALPELAEVSSNNLTDRLTTAHLGTGPTGDAVTEQALRQRSDRASSMERARELFKQGLEFMESGVYQAERGYKVEPGVAQLAAEAFQSAAELVPSSVAYRYYSGVALRYAEGFELAIREFRRVLELDPSHYEARQQIAYGQRWHDAYAYPAWFASPPIEPGMLIPEPMLALLSPDSQPVTRLVLLREGNSKVVAVISRTPRNSWAVPLTDKLPAHVDIVLSRTQHGPIIAFYVVVEDKTDDPYKGETFLNPHDPGSPTYDACQLGQHILAQLARQDHTFLIFVDEDNRLLLSRRLDFDPQTQVNINRCLYDVQTLPAQIMEPERFQQAAQWHMEHFSLDQVK